jgi:hypothetical protein
MSKIYIGVDNGVTGTIGIIYPDGEYYFSKIPVKTEQSYTKTKQNITRIDNIALLNLFTSIKKENEESSFFAFIERPMVNPGRWKASISAVRCLESVLIIFECLEIPYQYIDSKEWQKKFLPSGLEGKALKKGSCDIAIRLFPKEQVLIKKHKDGDSLLIAEYAKRKGL